MVDGHDADDIDVARRSSLDRAMDRYAAGEDAAFVELYDAVEPRICRFALRQLRSRSAAEDVVQDTLLRIVKKRAEFRIGAAVLPWVYGIARHLIVDVHRLHAHEEHLPPEGSGEGGPAGPAPVVELPSPEERLDDRRREVALWAFLAKLPPAHREAFELVCLEGLSVVEAAEVLGISPANVKIRVFRAREALKQFDDDRWR